MAEEAWEEWTKQYNKIFQSEEAKKNSFDQWKINNDFIERHNAEFKEGVHSFLTGHNKYSDLSSEEFATIKGINAEQQEDKQDASNFELQGQNPADTVDWRDKGCLNAVQDQGQCGCCYAFSAVCGIEAQFYLKYGKLVKLSEQNVVDCSSKYGNQGGNGGTMDNVFRYVKANGGIDTEQSYPYMAKAGHCSFNPANSAATVSGFTDIPQGDENALTQAIGTIGPVCIGIDASQKSFQLYQSGIYYDEKCSQTPDHAVVAVGYGSENGQDYYIVRNSWGTTWGEQGYVKMARNRDDAAGIASMASYPIIGDDPSGGGGQGGNNNQIGFFKKIEDDIEQLI